VIAYDRHSGDEIWKSVATEQVPHEPGHGTNTFASSSPVTDGKHLYINFGSRGVFCYDMDGNQKWQRDLGKMQTRAQFGEASSPALHENKLIIPWDHEGQSSLIALDTENGETVWKVDRDEATTWATPLVTPWRDGWQVITNGTTVRSYDLHSGELLWQAGGQVDNPIPTPVRHEDTVIAMTGYRGNAIHAIKLDAMGDVTGTDAVLWSRSDAAPYVASPVLYDGRLYFTKSRDGILSSVDATTGEAVISQQRLRDISSIYASPVAAHDRIYITGREGTTVVVRHSPNFEILATNRLDDVLDASPALVGDLMYLRGEKYLYCIGEKSAQ
jgi:outer membrane protein assembly factor BamB